MPRGMATRILLGGGTGLVGGLLTQRLLARADVALTSLVRRGVAPHERITDFEALIADPAGTAAVMGLGPVDVSISCLGTTIRIAKTQAAFRRVDFDTVIALAKAAKSLGARQFIVVTSVGAKQGAGNFYLSVKGDTEAALGALGFERLDILRPGLILGDRADRRPAEELGQRIAAFLNPFLKAAISDYAAIEAGFVSAAIAALAGDVAAGRFIHHNAGLERLSGAENS
jgi:uncharacterized protein YbjT (DUF2867 family)